MKERNKASTAVGSVADDVVDVEVPTMLFDLLSICFELIRASDLLDESGKTGDD